MDCSEESRYRAELFEAKLKQAKKRKQRAEEARSQQKVEAMFNRRRNAEPGEGRVCWIHVSCTAPGYFSEARGYMLG